MPSQYPLQTKRNVHYSLNYALIFCTKLCAAVLQGERGLYCKRELERLCAEHGYMLHSTTIKNSYIVLYLGLDPQTNVSTVVKVLKGVLARKLLKRFPELRYELPDTQLWSPLYFVTTMGEFNEDDLRDFIYCAAQTTSRQ